MRAPLLRDFSVETIAAGALIPTPAAGPHVYPSPAIAADRNTRGQHRYTRIRIHGFIKVGVRPDRRKQPLGGLLPVSGSIDELMIVSAEAHDRSGGHGPGSRTRIS